MQTKFIIGVAITAGSLFLLPMPSPAPAQDSRVSLSKQALKECEKGRLAANHATRLAHFQQGQTLGERAVAADEGSAEAHFGLFCNLGELLRIDGESLTSIFGLRRMMNELDRALEINPGYIDALSTKGTLLVKLPGFLGGDLEKGEQLLQQVVRQAPKAVNARLALARVWCQQGRHDEAMALASDALALAQKHQRVEFIPEAQALLQQAKTNAIKVKHPRF
jgi:tetratricopeptide (TPR) repeat protein